MIGFNGKIRDGLILTENEESLIFAVGNTLIIRNIAQRT